MKPCDCGCGVRVRGHFRAGHQQQSGAVKRYAETSKGGTKMLVHRVRAERALGKPLPPTAIVHHADGSKHVNAPLVILENQREHGALHARMRIQAAGGNPWTDKLCSRCRQVKTKTAFNVNRSQHDGLNYYCRACIAEIGHPVKAVRHG